MRVITGLAKGRRLTAPKGRATRPMQDRIKENVFNIIADRTLDAVVLDVFAGSGSLGVEALSRGAARAVFVDSSPEAVKAIATNTGVCGFEARSTIIRGQLPGALRGMRQEYDLIFADPPFRIAVSELVEVVEVLGQLLEDEGLLTLQTTTAMALPEFTGLALHDKRKYGQSLITMYVRSS